MTVAELIDLLKKYLRELTVIYSKYSEFCLLESQDIGITVACEPREDGWVHTARHDKKSKIYLSLPGN